MRRRFAIQEEKDKTLFGATSFVELKSSLHCSSLYAIDLVFSSRKEEIVIANPFQLHATNTFRRHITSVVLSEKHDNVSLDQPCYNGFINAYPSDNSHIIG